MYAIETENLSKYYSKGKIKALDNFSFKLEKGKIFSLLGANGAGKTTLMKLLLSIVSPTDGNATIFGKDISDSSCRNKIGYLAENHKFPEYLNAEQVLYHYGELGKVKSSLLKKRIPTLLKSVNLEGKEKIKIKKFSKGMLQRLGIAQALVNDPDLLFLDEPTDGIDPIGRKEIREVLLDLKTKGKTVFINSHLLSEVERISDEIIILKKGKIIKKGTVNEFISVENKFKIKLDLSTIKSKPLQLDDNTKYEVKDDTLIITALNYQELNKIIDNIRTKEIIIKEISPVKISLEDFFIKVIED